MKNDLFDRNQRHQSKVETNCSRHKRSLGKQRTFVLLFSLYITFIMLSQIPYLAQQSFQSSMKPSYEYSLTFNTDGWQEHYYVERYDMELPGTIDLIYTTSSNVLTVDVDNIKVLMISCRSVYEDESQEVFSIDPNDSSNFYKFYFIERDHFNVNIDTPSPLETLTFLDAPRPNQVFVNGKNWYEGIEYNYTSIGGIALSEVQAGHTNVDIYFKTDDGRRPHARAHADPPIALKGWNVTFSGGSSFDPDGKIMSYVWDFGDGTYAVGKETKHAYTDEGTFGAILTVEDDTGLIDHDYCNVTVVPDNGRPSISPPVSDQEVEEDAPSWSINLLDHYSNPRKMFSNISWSVSGNDPSICTISYGKLYEDVGGESPAFWFTPTPNAWGDQELTLWLLNDGEELDFQTFWLNITPVNDPPAIINSPSLIIHFDADYTFDYTPYTHDIDTEIEDLTLSVADSYEGGQGPIVEGLNVTYNYPESLLGTSVYATLTVSDGEATGVEMVRVNITDDWVPLVIRQLPDIEMYEGDSISCAFDLDDYFDDPDEDALFYSYGETYIEVTIQGDHCVDITTPEGWSGVDTVTFRASDPIGAMAEDTILVSVWAVNDPPVISNVPDLTVHHSLDYHFDLRPYIFDPDNGKDELILSSSNEAFYRTDSFLPTVMVLHYPESFKNMSVPLTITVSDGELSDSQTIQVKVSDNYPPIIVESLPDVTFHEDTYLKNAIQMNYHFEDLDGDMIFYPMGQAMVEIDIVSSGAVNFGAKKDWFGEEKITLRALDTLGAIAEDTILVTVLPVNDAPGFLDIPEQNGTVADVWVLHLDQYIFDVDNPTPSLQIFVDGPEGLVEARGHDLIISPTKPGGATFVLTVSDGKLENSTTLEVFAHGEDPTAGMVKLSSFYLYMALVSIIIMSIVGAISYRRYHGDYQIDAVMLIDSDGGTLIASRLKKHAGGMDEDILGSMFSAVTDFVQESFGSLNKGEITTKDKETESRDDDSWTLHELNLGEHTIVVERGTCEYLALVITGRVGSKLTKRMKRFIKEVEAPSPTRFKNWDGRVDLIGDVESLIDKHFPRIISEETVRDQKGKHVTLSEEMILNAKGNYMVPEGKMVAIDEKQYLPLDNPDLSVCVASTTDKGGVCHGKEVSGKGGIFGPGTDVMVGRYQESPLGRSDNFGNNCRLCNAPIVSDGSPYVVFCDDCKDIGINIPDPTGRMSSKKGGSKGKGKGGHKTRGHRSGVKSKKPGLSRSKKKKRSAGITSISAATKGRSRKYSWKGAVSP